MTTITYEEFEQLVSEGISEIPEKFLRRIKNVAVCIEDAPTKEQLRENNVPAGGTLLGLYHGVPLPERGSAYGVGGVLPDKITIFKQPIQVAGGDDPDRIRQIVKDTVWHEIAHYFGMDEHMVRHEEHKRGKTL